MSSICDVADDMWNVPLTRDLITGALGFSSGRDEGTYYHHIKLSNHDFERIGSHEYFGYEFVELRYFCRRWFIRDKYNYGWMGMRINDDLGYPSNERQIDAGKIHRMGPIILFRLGYVCKAYD